MTGNNPDLLIVYNAEGGLFNMVADAVHKIVSPGTYPCSLCAVTYGPISMRNAWRKYLATLPNQIVFHHKDDFAEAFPGVAAALPAIFTRLPREQPRILLSASELDAIGTVHELIAMVNYRLAERNAAARSA